MVPIPAESSSFGNRDFVDMQIISFWFTPSGCSNRDFSKLAEYVGLVYHPTLLAIVQIGGLVHLKQ